LHNKEVVLTLSNKRYNINLPAHMAECDTNYLRLLKLFPSLREVDLNLIGVVAGEQPFEVRFEVLERARYTTLVRLTQLSQTAWNGELRLTVRLYHDARSAEVVEYQGKRHFRAAYDYPNEHMRQPDEKAQINRFLGEYLSHCLRHGVAVTEPVLAGG
jgi:uncharacterized protein YqiB (DUF1249 family)